MSKKIISKYLKNNFSKNEIIRFENLCKKEFIGFLKLFKTQTNYPYVIEFFAEDSILYSHLKYNTGYSIEKNEADILLMIKIYRFLEKALIDNDPEIRRYNQETKEKRYGSKIICLEPYFESGYNIVSEEELMDEIRSEWL